MAAAGQTNRDISNALFITAKSVEWHLSNVYRKLDLRNRTGLPAALAGSGRTVSTSQRFDRGSTDLSAKRRNR